ncbi:hypothetical protein [Ferviditalea candida]|uniref:Uncharacterized protein n=1 Tax=Ferviditalea candida TaxID=3108399 RepID=A0ABU5ZFK6_9BACL|nr:hypothetical protein [Paenibacillaceae bacterium T2]
MDPGLTSQKAIVMGANRGIGYQIAETPRRKVRIRPFSPETKAVLRNRRAGFKSLSARDPWCCREKHTGELGEVRNRWITGTVISVDGGTNRAVFG